MSSVQDNIFARYRELAGNNDDPTEHAGELAVASRLTPAHYEVINLLRELLDLGEHNAPNGMRLLIQALRRMEPQLLESFGSVDPELVVAFLHRMGNRLLAVGSETSGPRAHQSA